VSSRIYAWSAFRERGWGDSRERPGERPRYADFIADNPAVGNATLTLHAQSSDTHVRAASDPAMAAVYSLPTTSPGGITISRQFTQWPRR
jgi:hypothetical protein